MTWINELIVVCSGLLRVVNLTPGNLFWAYKSSTTKSSVIDVMTVCVGGYIVSGEQ